MRIIQLAITVLALAGMATACGKGVEEGNENAENPNTGTGGDIFGGTGGAGNNGTGGNAGTGGNDGTGGDATGGIEEEEEYDGPVAAQATKGSAIALSPDGSLALAVNRDVGSVTIFSLEFTGDQGEPELNFVREIPLGAGSEPWQVAIGPDGTTGYVILREAQSLIRIDDLGANPSVSDPVEVGSEPTGLTLSPTGRTAYVANWNDGTVSVVDTAGLVIKRTIDLNPALVATGYLGDVEPRPGLSHPRSLAVTNDNDTEDLDETLYVTEYFAQQIEEANSDGSNADRLKAGLVYAVDLDTGDIRTVRLNPLADMGFVDNNDEVAGCFPNQLQDISIQGDYAYVASVCASPKGPVSFKTNTAPVISVIDLASNVEVSQGGQNLNRLFEDLYDDDGVADDASRRFPLLANEVVFVPGKQVGYVTAGGSNAVFRFEIGANGLISQVGSANNRFINLAPAGIDGAKAGLRPIGMVISPVQGSAALVVNDVSRNVSLLNFNTQALQGGAADAEVLAITTLPASGSNDERVRQGKRFFTTGLARWSLNGQAWGACESCHSDGLTDNVTWHFPTGPRQSIAMDGTFAPNDPSDQRVLNWTSVRDEVHDFELNTRGVSGGVGAAVFQISDPLSNDDRIDLASDEINSANLNGSAEEAMDPPNNGSLLEDWNNINAWVQTIRAPRRPANLPAELVSRGRQLFTEGGCRGCHGGAKWTISERFYQPSAEVNADLAATNFEVPAGFPESILPAIDEDAQLLRFQAAGIDQIQCVNREVGTFDVAEEGVGIAELRQDMSTLAMGGGIDGNGRGYNSPSLFGVAAGAPYLHGGNARTLEALFSETFSDHFRALSANLFTESDADVRAANVNALIFYLMSIDEDENTFTIPNAGAEGGQICSDNG